MSDPFPHQPPADRPRGRGLQHGLLIAAVLALCGLVAAHLVAAHVIGPHIVLPATIGVAVIAVGAAGHFGLLASAAAWLHRRRR